MDHRRLLSYENGVMLFDGFSLADAARHFGTPTYLYSASDILGRLEALRSGLSGVAHLICYAVKANSNIHILRMLSEAGAGADIVSGGELYRAGQAGVPHDRIVFSGVGKTRAEMRSALRAGILLFIVESEPELEALSAEAVAMGRSAPVSIRVNPNIDPKTHPYISTGLRENKFGIPQEDALRLFRRALELPGIEPVGLGSHIGSQLTDLTPFREAARLLSGLAREVRALGVPLRFVDVGGGLGIRYSQETPPSTQDYVRALRESLDVPGCTIILEPGRSLVGNAGILLTEILYRKPGPEKSFVVCDAAMNDLLRPALYQAHHDVLPVRESALARTDRADLVGPVCESGDFLARNRELPEFAAGDLAVLASAGAYGFTMSSNYNSRPRAAEVLVENGRARLIRRRETFADLVGPELDLEPRQT